MPADFNIGIICDDQRKLGFSLQHVQKLCRSALVYFYKRSKPIYIGELATALNLSCDRAEIVVNILNENGYIKKLTKHELSALGVIESAELFELVGSIDSSILRD